MARLVRKRDRATSHIALDKLDRERGIAIATKALIDLGVASTAVAIGWHAVKMKLVPAEEHESIRRRAHELVKDEVWFYVTEGRRGKGGDLIWMESPLDNVIPMPGGFEGQQDPPLPASHAHTAGGRDAAGELQLGAVPVPDERRVNGRRRRRTRRLGSTFLSPRPHQG